MKRRFLPTIFANRVTKLATMLRFGYAPSLLVVQWTRTFLAGLGTRGLDNGRASVCASTRLGEFPRSSIGHTGWQEPGAPSVPSRALLFW